jgi:hypothetical protein
MAKLLKVYIAGHGFYKRHALHHEQLYIARHVVLLPMNREVQVRNPGAGAAPGGKEGGPSPIREIELVRGDPNKRGE